VNCGLPMSLVARKQILMPPVSSMPNFPAVYVQMRVAWEPASIGPSGVSVAVPISSGR
jgi:hypothetical protein